MDRTSDSENGTAMNLPEDSETWLGDSDYYQTSNVSKLFRVAGERKQNTQGLMAFAMGAARMKLFAEHTRVFLLLVQLD